MIKFYQNRELSQKLGVNLAKWKRWSREFLAPDPLGGLQSGYARQYNLDDALTVYLGGFLVAGLKFSIPEAKQILSDLKDWMLSHHFYYYFDHINGNGEDGNKPIGFYRIYIGAVKNQKIQQAQFSYLIQRILAAEPMTTNGRSVQREDYIQEIMGSEPQTAAKVQTQTSGLPMGARVLYLTNLYKNFMNALGVSMHSRG